MSRQSFHIAWYATGLRGDKLTAVLEDVTPTALRYGGYGWSLHRSKDDRHKILQVVGFDDKLDFERWWNGREMVEMRTITSGWWQVPLLYVPHETLGQGHIDSGGERGGGLREQTAPAVTEDAEPAPAA
jgi:hypothetical protein